MYSVLVVVVSVLFLHFLIMIDEVKWKFYRKCIVYVVGEICHGSSVCVCVRLGEFQHKNKKQEASESGDCARHSLTHKSCVLRPETRQYETIY